MKKGFTLIELIGIIVILGVISFIVFPVVSSSIKNGKEKAYNEQVGRIIEAAKKWANDNTDLLPSDDEELYVNINTLVSSGFIKKNKEGNLINPKDNTNMTGCVLIRYASVYNQYTFEYTDCE